MQCVITSQSASSCTYDTSPQSSWFPRRRRELIFQKIRRWLLQMSPSCCGSRCTSHQRRNATNNRGPPQRRVRPSWDHHALAVTLMIPPGHRPITAVGSRAPTDPASLSICPATGLHSDVKFHNKSLGSFCIWLELCSTWREIISRND